MSGSVLLPHPVFVAVDIQNLRADTKSKVYHLGDCPYLESFGLYLVGLKTRTVASVTWSQKRFGNGPDSTSVPVERLTDVRPAPNGFLSVP
jgi:hypothetical protein